ncbi:MAG: hypothetical protein ACK5O2_11490 [Microthrixaceae bacterium]
MRNMGESDHVIDDDLRSDGFKLTPRHIVGGVIALVLLVFILANGDETNVSLLFVDVDLPLWLTLAVTALLGGCVGMLLGSRRAKAKLRA